MRISNAYCKKHDEIEPQDWDFVTEGLWTCPCCLREDIRSLKPDQNKMKALDAALAEVEKIFGRK